MLEEVCEIGIKVETAELLEVESFSGDWGLIDAGEGFE